MSRRTDQWLVSGHAILDSYADLRALCEAQVGLLGPGATIIAESGLAVYMARWSSFDKTDWPRGRLFGPAGEIQWRSFGSLVRVAVLIDTQNEAEAIGMGERLQQVGLTMTAHQLPVVSADQFLQTNEDEFPAVTVYQYGSEQAPSTFARYGQVQLGKT